jgi:hypothetical protein
MESGFGLAQLLEAVGVATPTFDKIVLTPPGIQSMVLRWCVPPIDTFNNSTQSLLYNKLGRGPAGSQRVCGYCGTAGTTNGGQQLFGRKIWRQRNSRAENEEIPLPGFILLSDKNPEPIGKRPFRDQFASLFTVMVGDADTVEPSAAGMSQDLINGQPAATRVLRVNVKVNKHPDILILPVQRSNS